MSVPHEAIDACAHKAERVTNFSVEAAAEWIYKTLKFSGKQVKGEVLVTAAKNAGHVPHDDRAFGSVFSSLSRQGRIKTVGFCLRKRGHGTAGGRIWEAAA